MRQVLHRPSSAPAAVVFGIFGILCCDVARPAGTIDLPKPRLKGEVSVEEALSRRRSIRSYTDRPLTLQAISQLCWAAQGITREETGFRTAPSAGATYPLELYVVWEKGVYRYDPRSHRLEARVAQDKRGDLAQAALGQRMVAQAPAVFVISAVYERTGRRYGRRAVRYVHMEAGHVGQNIALQAVALGLGSVPVGAFHDGDVAEVLELPKDEAPLYIIPVGEPVRRRP